MQKNPNPSEIEPFEWLLINRFLHELKQIDSQCISVYYPYFSLYRMEDQAWLLVVAIASAFLGTFLGNRLVKKVTMRSIQMLVSVMLLGIAIGLAGGLL